MEHLYHHQFLQMGVGSDGFCDKTDVVLVGKKHNSVCSGVFLDDKEHYPEIK